MKNKIIFLITCMALSYILIGCGGGGSGSPSSGTSAENTGSSSGSFASLEVNPITDLGLDTGSNVCFSIKSYNNITESDFSKAICSKIKNDGKLTLSWNKNPRSVSGYYVYYGTNKNNAKTFLADVITS